MVIRDLSIPESTPLTADRIRVASVSDRLTAAVFDFLIISPVIGLFVAGLLRKLKTYMLIEQTAPEVDIIWFLFITAYIFLAIIIQALFLFFLQATPGQKFLFLKVVSYPQKTNQLTLGQSLLRSFLFFLSFLFMGLPFLEILGHPLRRAVHEKASDTMVVSTRKDFLSFGFPIEVSRIISSWMLMFVIALVAIGGIYYFHIYSLVEKGFFTKDRLIKKQYFCEEYVEAKEGSRMDKAIAYYLSDKNKSECLRKEADFILWTPSHNEKPQANFAKALLEQDASLKIKYFEQACRSDAADEFCELALFIKNGLKNVRSSDLKKLKHQSITSKMFLLNLQLKEKNYTEAIDTIRELRGEEKLLPFLDQQYVKSIWLLNKLDLKERMPASENKNNIILEFEKYFGAQ